MTDGLYYDVVIIGAGPSGLSCANILAPYTSQGLTVALLESNHRFGGAGGNTDNKWNLPPEEDVDSVTGFQHLTEKQGGPLKKIYIVTMGFHGAELMEDLLHGRDLEGCSDLGQPDWYMHNEGVYNHWKERLGTVGLSLEPLVQFHIGSDRGTEIMQRWGHKLQQEGIETYMGTKAEEIEVLSSDKEEYRFKIKAGDKTFYAKNCVVGPGRSKVTYGNDFLSRLKSIGLETVVNSIDIGLRIEFENWAMREITEWPLGNGESIPGIYDPKIRYTSPTDDKLRLFCSNLLGGHLALERIGDYIIVNGESSRKDHGKCPANTAVLEALNLNSPNNNAIDFAMNALFGAKLLTTSQGKTPKVLIQRLGDFLGDNFYRLNDWLLGYQPGDNIRQLQFPSPLEWDSRRSRYTQGEYNSFDRNGWFHTTLETESGLQGTPGDFRLAYNERVMSNIRNMILTVGMIFPGILLPSTVLAGPEFKSYAERAVTNRLCESNIPGLLFIGDGGQGTHGIAPSYVSGATAAFGILLGYGMTPVIQSVGKYYEITPDFIGHADVRV